MALSEDNPKHKVSTNILSKVSDIEVCVAAFLEIAWLLRSKGKGENEISLALAVLKSELESH